MTSECQTSLQLKFTQLIEEVIKNNITDLHIGSGEFPFIRMANRNVEPTKSFGKLSHEEVIHIILFMNPDLTVEKINTIATGINFIYEYQGTRFRANVSKNNEGVAMAAHQPMRLRRPVHGRLGYTGCVLSWDEAAERLSRHLLALYSR